MSLVAFVDELLEVVNTGVKYSYLDSENYDGKSTPAWMMFRNPETSSLIKFGIDAEALKIHTLSVAVTIKDTYYNVDIHNDGNVKKYASVSQNIKFSEDPNDKGLLALVKELTEKQHIADFVECIEKTLNAHVSIDDSNKLLICFLAGELEYFPLEQFMEGDSET